MREKEISRGSLVQEGERWRKGDAIETAIVTTETGTGKANQMFEFQCSISKSSDAGADHEAETDIDETETEAEIDIIGDAVGAGIDTDAGDQGAETGGKSKKLTSLDNFTIFSSQEVKV